MNEKNMCMYRDTSEKCGLSYTNPEKMGSVIYFLLKKGLVIYFAALKKGVCVVGVGGVGGAAFGTRIHTMPYIRSYPPPRSRLACVAVLYVVVVVVVEVVVVVLFCVC